MPTPPRFPLRIYYDGACGVCAAEIERYARGDHGGRLLPVDISAADFDPAAAGFSHAELMYQLHAVDQAGTVYRNIEAFWAIWQAFPQSTLLGFLGRLLTRPLLAPLARLGYRAFARLRRFLPQRAPACRLGRRQP